MIACAQSTQIKIKLDDLVITTFVLVLLLLLFILILKNELVVDSEKERVIAEMCDC